MCGPGRGVCQGGGWRSAVLLPTLMNIKRLAQSRSVSQALDGARARPPFTVVPILEPDPEGTTIHIPEAAGYGHYPLIRPAFQAASAISSTGAHAT